MRTEDFKEKAEDLLTELETMITDELPFKGNSEEESQKVCLMNAIHKLRSIVNGVEDSDFDGGENA